MSHSRTNSAVIKKILKQSKQHLPSTRDSSKGVIIKESEIEQTDAISFKAFHHSLLNLFEKRKYKKIYQEIFKNEKNNVSQNKANEYILTHFQITTILFIIKRKVYRRILTINTTHFEKWLNKLYEQISILSNDIKTLPIRSQPGHYEKVTYYYLSYFYYNAILSKHHKNIPESINYLCLCEKLIDNVYNNITFPETLNIIQQIYLYKAGIFISDQCFDSAINVLKKVIYIAYKEIELYSYMSHKNRRHNINYGISYFFPKSLDNPFYNICICFYQLGVIHENLELPFESNTMYMESKYFAVTFLLKTNLHLCKFLNNIANMSSNKKAVFHELISEYKTPSYLRKVNLNFENNNVISSIKKTHLNNCSSCRLFSTKRKYYLLEHALSDANIKEIDYDDKDLLNKINSKPRTNAVKKMTNGIQLMNYLLNNEFKPVINSMSKCEFNSFSQETKNKVQRQINIIKANLRTKQNKKHKSNKCLVLNTNVSELQKSSSKSNIKKIVHDKYIFNKTFQNKISFINHQMDREYRFQKGLLRCKKYEKIYCEPFDTEKIKSNADLFFRYHLTEEQKRIKDNEKRKDETKKKLSFEIEKIDKVKTNINKKEKKEKEKGPDIYFVFLKNLLDKASPELRKEFGLETVIENTKDLENRKFIKNINEIPSLNNNMINQLEFDIDQINKKEDAFKLRMSRKKQNLTCRSFSSIGDHKRKDNL